MESNVHLEIKFAESLFNLHCHIRKLSIHTRDTLMTPSHHSDDFAPCLSNLTRQTSPRTLTCNFTSNFTPQTSHLRSQTSHLDSHTTDLTPQTSDLTPRTSDFRPPTSNLRHHTSDLTPKHLTPHTSPHCSKDPSPSFDSKFPFPLPGRAQGGPRESPGEAQAQPRKGPRKAQGEPREGPSRAHGLWGGRLFQEVGCHVQNPSPQKAPGRSRPPKGQYFYTERISQTRSQF